MEKTTINVRIITRPENSRVTINVRPKSRLARLTAAALLTVGLSACNTLDRLSYVGKAPDHSDIKNPVETAEYKPVTTPQPEVRVGDDVAQANSLWRPGSRAFFRDQRAARVGDILTVKVNITDTANVKNETNVTRKAGETTGFPKILGFQSEVGKLFPGGFDPSAAVSTSTDVAHDGKGEIKRNETISTNIAAMIIQKLQNGNLVIQGTQEVRVDNELRQMNIRGIIRPEDIASDNTITHDKIADARITYGGKGQVSDVQGARYGQQILDIISPF